MDLAEESRVSLGDWFLTPLHPVKGDLSAWGYEYGKYPVAEYLAEHVVNLPTMPSDVGRVIGFLEENLDEIGDSWIVNCEYLPRKGTEEHGNVSLIGRDTYITTADTKDVELLVARLQKL